MKLHSFVDVITNSSTTVYCSPTRGWKKQTTKLLDFILQDTGQKAKDLFTVGSTSICFDLAEEILCLYIDKEEISGKDGAKVKKLLEKYLETKKLSLEDGSLTFDYDPTVVQGFLDILIQAYGAKKPQLDCDCFEAEEIIVISKQTGKSIDLEEAFRSIFDIEESYE